jgi:putative transposase
MARKPRLEVEGGLYHIITRGVDRRDIFHSAEDHQKFLSLLSAQKGKLPFFLYAYCLMTNHVHLLIERMTDDVGRIMHRVLTGYSQYYNRRYRRTGHLLQGRHKAILCQSDAYLAELVRYIHLNPVRAKMVAAPENYPWSSHRAYIGVETTAMIAVDVDPVLRRFGPKKELARERFVEHVAAAMGQGHLKALYTTKGGVLGSEEFVDSMIHHMGEFVPKAKPVAISREPLDAEILFTAVESVCGISRADFYGRAKISRLVSAKELLIICGLRLGGTTTMLSGLVGLSVATVSRRRDAAITKMDDHATLKAAADQVTELYRDSVRQQSSEL